MILNSALAGRSAAVSSAKTAVLVDISTALRVDLYTLLGSNIPVHPDVSISVEFASMLKDAAPEQVKLCLSVCKTIIEHGESHQFK